MKLLTTSGTEAVLFMDELSVARRVTERVTRSGAGLGLAFDLPVALDLGLDGAEGSCTGEGGGESEELEEQVPWLRRRAGCDVPGIALSCTVRTAAPPRIARMNKSTDSTQE